MVQGGPRPGTVQDAYLTVESVSQDMLMRRHTSREQQEDMHALRLTIRKADQRVAAAEKQSRLDQEALRVGQSSTQSLCYSNNFSLQGVLGN